MHRLDQIILTIKATCLHALIRKILPSTNLTSILIIASSISITDGENPHALGSVRLRSLIIKKCLRIDPVPLTTIIAEVTSTKSNGVTIKSSLM